MAEGRQRFGVLSAPLLREAWSSGTSRSPFLEKRNVALTFPFYTFAAENAGARTGSSKGDGERFASLMSFTLLAPVAFFHVFPLISYNFLNLIVMTDLVSCKSPQVFQETRQDICRRPAGLIYGALSHQPP